VAGRRGQAVPPGSFDHAARGRMSRLGSIQAPDVRCPSEGTGLIDPAGHHLPASARHPFRSSA